PLLLLPFCVHRYRHHRALPSFPTRRSSDLNGIAIRFGPAEFFALTAGGLLVLARISGGTVGAGLLPMIIGVAMATVGIEDSMSQDRKSTRLNSSHVSISYAVFCLKKKRHRS